MPLSGDRAHPKRAFAAMFLGVALFCIAAYFGLTWTLDGDMNPFSVFVLTPLFGLPLAVVHWPRARWWGLAYFVLGLTACHFAATWVAALLYLDRGAVDVGHECAVGFSPLYNDPLKQQQCLTAAHAVKAQLGLVAGFAGGFVGAALSFAALLLAARFRGRRLLNAMAGATALLAGIGGAAFWLVLPDKMEPLDWVLVLFLPWQIVFGSALVLLFSDRFARPA
jgi:hypothetical protein